MNDRDISIDRLRENLRDDVKELAKLERDELVLEGEEHHGFTDAIRATRLKSQVEALDTQIQHEEMWLKANGG